MIKETEQWKDIFGYEFIYQISNYGNVKSLARKTDGQFGLRSLKEKYLNAYSTDRNYKRVTLNYGGQKHFFIHRLVAIAFIPNTENKPFINHIDGVRNNNFIKT